MSSFEANQAYPPLTRTPSPGKDPDAGLKALDHYQRRLPKWRHRLRQALIPIVRAETPILAKVQEKCRTPFLDSYFAITANLGTHTFFMAALPICFWCGYPKVGVSLVSVLALGVYLSGALKDALCLPRPLSPPLNRITMSGSAALEYGFPSTHTTNAVSVALFAILELAQVKDSLSTRVYFAAQAGLVFYALSIMLGRMYCGMHGFFDVFTGIALGAFITWIRVVFGPLLDSWVLSGDFTRPLICTVFAALAVRFHPEPADNCPCFDDSVAFSGVVMGMEFGLWTSALTLQPRLGFRPTMNELHPYTNDDIPQVVLRLLLGITTIFVWRAMMKPLLLKSLPPVYRFVDHWGFRLPRRYFKQSRDYKQVPQLRDDDKVLPPASEIPNMISNIRHPRKRTVSVGPQSEADVREFYAAREQRHRSQSRSGSGGPPSKPPVRSMRSGLTLPSSPGNNTALFTPTAEESVGDASYMDPRPQPRQEPASSLQVQKGDANLLTPPASDNASDGLSEDERQTDRRIFDQVEKPRVRYDVEVITKLVVYAGIGYITLALNPLLFERLGLV